MEQKEGWTLEWLALLSVFQKENELVLHPLQIANCRRIEKMMRSSCLTK